MIRTKRQLVTSVATCFAILALFAGSSQAGLIITGVFDGPLGGGEPKALELYATNNIPDLSVYAAETATNSAGATAPETFFPAISVSAGEFVYVVNNDNQGNGGGETLAERITRFAGFFGFTPTHYIDDNASGSAASFNGDDALILWNDPTGLFSGSETIIDRFGNDADADNAGETWDYQDGWAYRVDATGPDGNTFVQSNWTFSGENVNDGTTTNGESSAPFPIGTYQIPEPTSALLALLGASAVGLTRRR